MSEVITGTIKIFWESGLVDDDYLVLKDDFLWAEDWDEVEIENISDNPNIPTYKVVKVVWELEEEVKEEVENIIEWYFREGLHWNWYIAISWKKWQVFVSKDNTLWAKARDKVKAILWMIDWKPEALIKEIVKIKKEVYIWEVIEEDWKMFIKIDKRSGKIELLDQNLLDIKEGDILNISFDKEKNIIINEKLWRKGDIWIEIKKIAAANWLRLGFPEEVLSKVEALDWNIDSNEIAKRVDLRELLTITIDWPDSKDLDDAISIEILKDWRKKLSVHIADVTHYVKEDGEIDMEALLRGTSNYYADSVTPMLAERLSNDLCSLNPHTDKLTVTCEMIIEKNWRINIEESKVYESVINSDFRMTYEEIDKIKDGELNLWDELMFWNNITKDLINLVKNSTLLSASLSSVNKNSWKLQINSTESKIILDKNKQLDRIEAYPKHDSNIYIENFMVSANTAIPQILENMILNEYESLPFVHRTHGKPDEDAVEKLINILKVLDVKYEFKDSLPKSFSKLLETIKWHPKEKFLSKKITTTLQKAIYTAVRQWHFGLALEYYSHFTSPIRRYPDLQIHRIIKEILNWSFTEERYAHYISILDKVAEQSSITEDVAEKNEADVNKYLFVHYMKDKVGQKFKWYIDDINWKKTKVILENTISWLINFSDIFRYKFSKLDEGIYEVIDTKTNEVIWLGDNVELELEKVDDENMQIYFKLIK